MFNQKGKPMRYLFLSTLVIALFGVAACASSNTALRAHTAAASTIDDIADHAKDLVLEKRQAQLDGAADHAVAVGADVEVAIQAAAHNFDAGPTIPAFNAFINAKDRYVREVLVSASIEKPTWEAAKEMLKDVVDTYSELRLALGEPEAMPPLPATIAKLLTMTPRPTDPVGAVA